MEIAALNLFFFFFLAKDDLLELLVPGVSARNMTEIKRSQTKKNLENTRYQIICCSRLLFVVFIITTFVIKSEILKVRWLKQDYPLLLFF